MSEESITNRMRTVLKCETPTELSAVIEPDLIKRAINDLEFKGIMVTIELEEWTSLERLAYELLKQSAGIK